MMTALRILNSLWPRWLSALVRIKYTDGRRTIIYAPPWMVKKVQMELTQRGAILVDDQGRLL